MKKIACFGLILLGWVLCIPAILLGPLAKLMPPDMNRPWVDGLMINMWRAYARYNTVSWIRRMIGIYKNPSLTIQYLRILLNKQEVKHIGSRVVKVADLMAFHDVETTHDHHRARVQRAIEGKGLESQFGKMIVVDNLVHDGNHRRAAFIEAKTDSTTVEFWTTN